MKTFVFKNGDEEIASLTEEEVSSLSGSFGEIVSATQILFDKEITSITVKESEEE